MAKKEIKRKIKRVSYRKLNDGFKIPNDMFKFITNGYDFKVYCYLCSKFNPDLNYVDVSYKTISKDSSVDLTTVQRRINNLKNMGLISVKQNENGNNCYFINFIIDETEYEVKKQQTAIELFGKDIFDEDVEVLTEEEYNNMYKKPPRKEIVFLDKLEGVIGKIGIRQYRVFNYRIDYYIPNLNIAIEYDENDHKNYTYEQQEGRQKKIEKELGCRFIRISDKNSDEFNIECIISNL